MSCRFWHWLDSKVPHFKKRYVSLLLLAKVRTKQCIERLVVRMGYLIEMPRPGLCLELIPQAKAFMIFSQVEIAPFTIRRRTAGSERIVRHYFAVFAAVAVRKS